MIAVVARRLLWAIPSAILITALLFFSVAGLLGSPAALMLGQDATPQSIAELNARLGFDRPLLTQYADWMSGALVGDFGRSYSTHQTAAAAILPRLPVTLELGILAIGLAGVTAVVINSITAGRTVVRPVATALAVAGITLPNFALGLSLIFLFSVKLGWLPSIGWAPWSEGLWTHLKHILLPVLTLSAYYYGSFTLVYRAEYDAVSRRLFVRVAKAKGFSERQVSFRHVLPNAIMPVITYVGLSLGQLMGGAVVTESLFSIPGIGSLLVDSILSRDYPVMLAIGMITIAAVVIMNAAADALYSVANPQIRLK
ncbi:ABC transporter permease [Limobrevibacterium gyesilva]|uniref:ABC transporter permease n=1 Tax=Limobrevibacterium gyesilva TaxID=2991712 RepID=A0AA41YLY8_9PROT|nr:ABC transporter permease [Limobrevibacterium gyesilva]MCW3474742.1 ABC transporter permease [Limobrevibacterium gyesilva]